MNWLAATLLAGQDAEPSAPAAVEAAAPVMRWGWTLVAAALLLLWWRGRGRLSRSLAAVLLGATVLLACYGLPTGAQTALDRVRDSAWSQIGPWVSEPLLWGVLLGGLGMLLMLPRSGSRQRMQGAVVGIASLYFFLVAAVPPLAGLADQVVFWTLALVTIVSAAAAVIMRSAVYSAIWFALSLLGTAGLFFYQGSQFLGVATIVVYAGAIVVTFLFVLMLAQPEGQATYDRLTWGSLPKPLSVLAAALLVGCLALAVSSVGESRKQVIEALQAAAADAGATIDGEQLAGVSRQDQMIVVTVRKQLDDEQTRRLERSLAASLESSVQVQTLDPRRDVLHRSHMALLGAQLFGNHLLSVELAGTLLLAALVGAIAMAIHGKDLETAEDLA